MSLPPAEAASVCLHEVITHACNASHCISPECDYDSIEKLELLWIELLSFPKSSLDSMSFSSGEQIYDFFVYVA
jgi:hypothetical protein